MELLHRYTLLFVWYLTPLTPLTGEQLSGNANSSDDAIVDIKARSFWQEGQKAFFDVRVFNPFAQTYLNQTLENAFASNEKEKKRAYNQRIISIEHGSFSPLVFTPYGGCGKETEKVITMLASKIAIKKDLDYGKVTNWLRTKISFVLLRSAILCIRGSRNWRKGARIDIGDIEISTERSQM